MPTPFFNSRWGAEPRRLRVGRLNADVLVQLFARMSITTRRFETNGWPLDARLVDFWAENWSGQPFCSHANNRFIYLLLESDQWDVVPPGAAIPGIDLQVLEYGGEQEPPEPGRAINLRD
jgi:hypothetical protein